MINELERVVLTESVPEESLETGDVGTVVHVYGDGKAFEVEFTTLAGVSGHLFRSDAKVSATHR